MLVAPPKLWWSKISSHIARRHWAKLYHDNHKCGSLCNYKMVWIHILSVQFSAQLCPTLCIPMTCSMPSCPVHHQHLGFTQTHDHWVSDGIQPSHPLSSPSPPTFNPSQHQGFFLNKSVLCIKWPKIGVSASASVLPMNSQDWIHLGWTGWISLQSKGLSRICSNTTAQKHQFFGVQLSL